MMSVENMFMASFQSVKLFAKKILTFHKPISEIYKINNNAFDVLRFIMASLVIVHHSYDLIASPHQQLFLVMTRWQLTLGSFAVGNFFVISGFLIAQSLLNSRNLLEYFLKRFLRLFPALFVSLFLSAVVLGPLVTRQDIWRYFWGGEGTHPLQFVFLNFTLNIFGFSYSIRDVFAGNPFPYAVNGSLWTLKHEFASYVILAGISLFGALRHPRWLLFFTFFVGGVYLVDDMFGLRPTVGILKTWWVLNDVEYPYFLYLLWLFLCGAILYIYRDKIYINTWMLVFALVVIFISRELGYLYYVWNILSPYLIIGIAILFPFSWFSKYGDFSYGIYIYAFPVQQSLAYLYYPEIDVYSMIFYSFIVTLILSILSWYLVEKPALRLKKKFVHVT